MRERHPEYEEERDRWEQYYAAYMGGEAVFRYIRSHSREHEELYKTRKKRAYYLNFTEAVVNLICSFVYSYDIVRIAHARGEDVVVPEATATELAKQDKAIRRDAEMVPPVEGASGGGAEPTPDEAARFVEVEEAEEHEDLRALWEDADLAGTSLSDFMKTSTAFSKVFGHTYILVDMPRVDGRIETEAQRKERGVRPYLVLLLPWSVVDWEVDERGQYLWVRIKETVGSKPTPDGARTRFPDEVYLTWTRDEWTRHRFSFNDRGDPVAVDVERGAHPVGRVPVIRHYHQRKPQAVTGLSMIRDIAPVNLAILNYCSLMDEDAYERCLSILVMKGDGLGTDVQLSAHNVLEYTQDPPPHYLAPPGTPMEMLSGLVERLRDEIYRMARLGSSMGLLSKEAKSGIAYSFEFNETSRMLADTANEAESVERQVHDLYLRWLGQVWTGVIDYPEEFGVESMGEEFKVVTAAKQAVRSPTFKRVVEKLAARKLVTKMSDATKRRIDAEIDQLEEPKPPPFFGFGGG